MQESEFTEKSTRPPVTDGVQDAIAIAKEQLTEWQKSVVKDIYAAKVRDAERKGKK